MDGWALFGRVAAMALAAFAVGGLMLWWLCTLDRIAWLERKERWAESDHNKLVDRVLKLEIRVGQLEGREK